MNDQLRDPENIADIFVVAGLPENPTPYDTSYIGNTAAEVLLTDEPDLSKFRTPIVEVALFKVGTSTPKAFTFLSTTYDQKSHAVLKGKNKEEYIIGFRRAESGSFITNIGFQAKQSANNNKRNLTRLTHTYDGEPVARKDYFVLEHSTPEASVDCLGVTDIIFVNKKEDCPVSYFLLDTPIRNGLILGSALHLCYRKSLVKRHVLVYSPAILSHHIVSNPGEQPNSVPEDSFQLQMDQLADFCLPWGATIEAWDVCQHVPEPACYSFVLTNETGVRFYGTCVKFYEPYDLQKMDLQQVYLLDCDPEKLQGQEAPSTESTGTLQFDMAVDDPQAASRLMERLGPFNRSRIGNRVVAVTKTLCLVSRYQFSQAFAAFLLFLHRRIMDTEDCIPLERYLAHFLYEVPFPCQEMPNVSLPLGTGSREITFTLPSEDQHSGGEFFYELICRQEPEKLINMFLQFLFERAIIMTSIFDAVLTVYAEAFTALLAPFKWNFPYAPFCHLGLIKIVQYHSAMVLGLNSRYFDFFRLPEATSIAYLDIDTFTLRPGRLDDGTVIDSKILPRTQYKTLLEKLHKIKERATHLRGKLQKMQKRQPSQEERLKRHIGFDVRAAFLDLMVEMLYPYRRYLPRAFHTGEEPLFDARGFIHDYVSKDSAKFYTMLFQTQMWNTFIHECNFPSGRESEIQLFDAAVSALESRDDDFASDSEESAASANTSLLQKLLKSGHIKSEFTKLAPACDWPVMSMLEEELDAEKCPEAERLNRLTVRRCELKGPVCYEGRFPVHWDDGLFRKLIAMKRLNAPAKRMDTISIVRLMEMLDGTGPERAAALTDSDGLVHLPAHILPPERSPLARYWMFARPSIDEAFYCTSELEYSARSPDEFSAKMMQHWLSEAVHVWYALLPSYLAAMPIITKMQELALGEPKDPSILNNVQARLMRQFLFAIYTLLNNFRTDRICASSQASLRIVLLLMMEYQFPFPENTEILAGFRPFVERSSFVVANQLMETFIKAGLLEPRAESQYDHGYATLPNTAKTESPTQDRDESLDHEAPVETEEKEEEEVEEKEEEVQADEVTSHVSTESEPANGTEVAHKSAKPASMLRERSELHRCYMEKTPEDSRSCVSVDSPLRETINHDEQHQPDVMKTALNSLKKGKKWLSMRMAVNSISKMAKDMLNHSNNSEGELDLPDYGRRDSLGRPQPPNSERISRNFSIFGSATEGILSSSMSHLSVGSAPRDRQVYPVDFRPYVDAPLNSQNGAYMPSHAYWDFRLFPPSELLLDITHYFNFERMKKNASQEADSPVKHSIEPRLSYLTVLMSNCTTCPQCCKPVFDEDILSGWRNSRELTTSCPHCSSDSRLLPKLTVKILGNFALPQTAKESAEDGQRVPSSPVRSIDKPLAQIRTTFMNPLKLREVLDAELTGGRMWIPDAVDFNSRANLIWNLVWWIYRVKLPTHLLYNLPMWLLMNQQVQRKHYESGRLEVSDFIFTEDNAKAVYSHLTAIQLSGRWDSLHYTGSHNKYLYKFFNIQTVWKVYEALHMLLQMRAALRSKRRICNGEHLHCRQWCAEQSFYRELLFLHCTLLSQMAISQSELRHRLHMFETLYESAYQTFCRSKHPFLKEDDRPSRSPQVFNAGLFRLLNLFP